MKIYLKAFKIWIILAILSVGFAIFREAVFIPLTGVSFVLSRILLLPLQIGYVSLLAWFLLKKEDNLSQSVAWTIGVIWLVLTLIFEFVFGILIMEHSLQYLLQDYNVLQGRTWPYFLIAILISLPLINSIKKRNSD